MSNVERVRGPSGDPEPPKKKRDVDQDAFEELMRKHKTPETDPEEKRRSKQRHEIEEEAKADRAVESVEDASVEEEQLIELDTETFQTVAGKSTVSEELASQKPETPSSMESKQAAARIKKEKEATFAKEKAEEEQAEQPIEGVSPLPPGGWEAHREKIKEEKIKEEKVKEEKTQVEAISAKTEQELLFARKDISLLAETVSGSTGYLRLSPQMREIFERMVGVMTIMAQEGVKQTTMVLDSPQFANSLLFGSEITITEYSTAPRAFNIEFLGTSQAVNLMQGSIEELVAAFNAGHYTFKVNRIEAALLPSTRAVGRKVQKPKKRNRT